VTASFFPLQNTSPCPLLKVPKADEVNVDGAVTTEYHTTIICRNQNLQGKRIFIILSYL